MIHHAWSVLCSNSTIDRDTNNVSIFGVLEQIQVGTATQPAEDSQLPIQAHLVSLWYKTESDGPETGEARISLKSSAKVVPLVESYILDVTRDRLRTRVILSALPIRESGFYSICIEYRQGTGEWEMATTLPLDVRIEVGGSAAELWEKMRTATQPP